MKKIIRKNQKGVTLIELLIVASVFAMLSIAILGVYDMGLKIYKREYIRTNLQGELKIAMDRITKDTRHAIDVTPTYNTYTTDTSTTLILEMPAIDNDNNFIYDGEGNFVVDYVIYFKDDSSLNRIVDPNPLSSRDQKNVVMPTYANTLSLTYDPDIPTALSVDIILKTSDTFRGEELEIEINQTATLKNKW